MFYNGVLRRNTQVYLLHIQDFVRLPLQSQSSQSSHAVSAGSSTSSSDAGLTGAYGGSVSGQLNAGYPSGPGNTGLEAVSRPLDVGPEASESNSAALLRCFISIREGVFLAFIGSLLTCLSSNLVVHLQFTWGQLMLQLLILQKMILSVVRFLKLLQPLIYIWLILLMLEK